MELLISYILCGKWIVQRIEHHFVLTGICVFYVKGKIKMTSLFHRLIVQTVLEEIVDQAIKYYTLNVRSRGKQLVLFSWESWCFPRRSRGKHQDSRENKTNWFPEGPDIKCFVIFLDFHFNSNKRITGANQNSPLDTCNNTNLILKTTKWRIYKVLSLHYLQLFPAQAAVSLQGFWYFAEKKAKFRGIFGGKFAEKSADFAGFSREKSLNSLKNRPISRDFRGRKSKFAEKSADFAGF